MLNGSGTEKKMKGNGLHGRTYCDEHLEEVTSVPILPAFPFQGLKVCYSTLLSSIKILYLYFKNAKWKKVRKKIFFNMFSSIQ